MPKPGDYNALQAETGGAGPYIVKLLVQEPRRPDGAALFAEIRSALGRVDLLPGKAHEPLGFAFPQHSTMLADGKSVCLLHFVTPQEQVGDRGDLELALHQTWDWPLARDVVSHAKAMVLFHDMMAIALDRQTRLGLFMQALRVVVRHVKPLAIHWLPSQRVVDPAKVLAASELDVTTAAVNVRMFRVEGQSEGEIVMDTLGMASFALPDLQCHFRGLEPGRVAGMLYAYADYIFKNGDVIEDGNTVEGIVPGRKWRCQHEEAIVAPKRVVLDIDPGPARPPRR